ncbi:MAG: hypothetical protein ACK5HP_00170 [Bacilli bacterium]
MKEKIIKQKKEKQNINILNKMLNNIDKYININTKRLNNYKRIEKRKINTEFCSEYGDKVEKQESDVLNYKDKELVYLLRELIFNKKDITEVKAVLSKYTRCYTLILEKNYSLFDNIVDQYINILLNQNNNLNFDLNYFENIILEIVSYSKQNNIYEIQNSLNKKINKFLLLIESNNLTYTKKNNIIEQLLKLKELVELPKKNNDFIFSIEDEEKKYKETALSIKKVGDEIFMTFYVPNLVKLGVENNIDKSSNLYLINPSTYNFKKEFLKFFSLEQGRPKNVIEYHMVFNNKNEVKHFYITENTVSLNCNFNFKQVDNIFINETSRKGFDSLNIWKYFIKNNFLNKEQGKITKTNELVEESIKICEKELYKYCTRYDIPVIYNSYNSDSRIEFSNLFKNYIAYINQLSIIDSKYNEIYKLNQQIGGNYKINLETKKIKQKFIDKTK